LAKFVATNQQEAYNNDNKLLSHSSSSSSSCCFFGIRSFFLGAEFSQQFCLFVFFLHLQDGELYGLHVLEEEVVEEEEEEEEEKHRGDEHVTWHDAKENNCFARG
jgi:hypothetical protein